MVYARLKKIMQDASIRQKELALILGVSDTRVSQLMRGESEFKESQIILVCQALKIRPDELLACEDLMDDGERKVLAAYRAMSLSGRSGMLAVINDLQRQRRR